MTILTRSNIGALGKPAARRFDGYTSTSIEGVRKFTVKEWRDSLTTRFFDESPWEERDPFEDAIQNFAKIGVPA